GWTVPSAYDSMVLKLLVHAESRAGACDRMLRSLDELHIQGFATNKAFHQALFANPAFRAGDLSTRFLEEHPLQDQLQKAAQANAHARDLRSAAALAALDAMPGGLAALARHSAVPPVVAQGARRDWGMA
ncbi:MAG: hypothetical protein LC623_05275, partial [Halobacteriales archaeon]|nr:hypothetical protein [Halobacteriales archaeon]